MRPTCGADPAAGCPAGGWLTPDMWVPTAPFCCSGLTTDPLGAYDTIPTLGDGDPSPRAPTGAGDGACDIAEGGIRLACPAAVGWVAALMAEAKMGACWGWLSSPGAVGL